MIRLRAPLVVRAPSARVGARPAQAIVGMVSDTGVLLPLTAAAVGGIFGGVLWGLKGILVGGAAGGLLGVAAASSPNARSS